MLRPPIQPADFCFRRGEAWRAAWRRDPGLELFGTDGFHPTELGSYLVALVMYQQLTGRSPEGLPSPSTGRPGTWI